MLYTPSIQISVFGASGASHASGLVPDPGGSAGTTKFLREDATWQTPPGGVTIGGAVSGGTATDVLYVDGGGNLAQSSLLQFNATYLRVGSGGFLGDIGNTGAGAGRFQDGTRQLFLCDGTNAITYNAGNAADWAGAAPTDVWVALDRLAAACVAAGFTP